MISDPKSTPDHRLARLIFAVVTAVTACILQFEFRSREGLFYALALASLMTPLLDRGFRAQHFHWPGLRRAA
jgi:Na+-translocating ferredoxin:NAD+ oxidoreductase RnfD subunit